MFDHYQRFNINNLIEEELGIDGFSRFLTAVGKCANFVKPTLVSTSIYYAASASITPYLSTLAPDSLPILNNILISSSCALGVALTSNNPKRNSVLAALLSTTYNAACYTDNLTIWPSQAIRFSTIWFLGDPPALAEILR